MKKPSIIIVGAGLAGLAAAHELTKTNRYTVTLLEERNRIGGRTHTVQTQGISIDVGGFIIYPWYKTFHRIAQELVCDTEMIPIPESDIYYNAFNKNTFLSGKELPIPLSTKMKLATKLLPMLMNNLHVASPNLTHKKTTQAFFDEVFPEKKYDAFKTYIDSILQGYCYPAYNEFQLAFLLPMWGNNIFFGDIHRSFYYPNGMQTLHKKMEEYILAHEGVIKTNTKVLEVKKGTVITEKETLSCDAIIVTHPLHQEVTYTKFVTLTVACKGTLSVRKTNTWGALFLQKDTCNNPNILSIINNEILYGKKGENLLTLNIKLRTDEVIPEKETYEKNIVQELQNIFPDLQHCIITSSTPWNHTMPIPNTAYVEKIKKQQGKNGIYHAGDFLGSPSMETALTTGVSAAEQIIKKYGNNA